MPNDLAMLSAATEAEFPFAMPALDGLGAP